MKIQTIAGKTKQRSLFGFLAILILTILRLESENLIRGCNSVDRTIRREPLNLSNDEHRRHHNSEPITCCNLFEKCVPKVCRKK